MSYHFFSDPRVGRPLQQQPQPDGLLQPNHLAAVLAQLTQQNQAAAAAAFPQAAAAAAAAGNPQIPPAALPYHPALYGLLHPSLAAAAASPNQAAAGQLPAVSAAAGLPLPGGAANLPLNPAAAAMAYMTPAAALQHQLQLLANASAAGNQAAAAAVMFPQPPPLRGSLAGSPLYQFGAAGFPLASLIPVWAFQHFR